MSLSRRAFLASAAATGLSSCATRYTPEMAALCRPPSDPRLIIDAHCHLMNLKDGTGAALVTRRFLNFDEERSPGLERIAAALVDFVARILGGAALPVTRERGMLRVELTSDALSGRPTAPRSNTAFCFFAGHAQRGYFRADAERQITGFFSNRTRNAARMMTLFPDVDIFLPSMVDMYEGRTIASYPSQIAFYSELNLATRGRFLPLASFTPEREYEDRVLYKREVTQLDILKHAIDNLGFVGVKLHPSTGFSPHDNLRWGCLNTPRQRVRETDRELHHQFYHYDRYLEELYAFCKSRDVPILTHNSTGLTANSWCMRGAYDPGHEMRRKQPAGDFGDPEAGEWTYPYRERRRQKFPGSKASDDSWRRDEAEWTNAPQAWVAAMEAADRANPGLPPLKVILAHMANGPTLEMTGRKTARLHPSPWMKAAAEAMPGHPGLHVDLSEINEFFDAPNRGAHRELFHRFIAANPAFARGLVYGSDWHMPATAQRGAAYLGEVERLLPQHLRREVMGARAADLFGLRPGAKTRARLARFYADPPIFFDKHGGSYPPLDTADINWWSQV